MKMNKKRTGILAVALMLTMLMASMAYFTDVKTGTTNVDAGNVSLTDNTVAVDTNLMVPGDVKALVLDATYTGNVDAKVRVKLYNPYESVASTVTEGFRINDAGTPVDLSSDAFIDAADVSATITGISVPLEIELLAESDNRYQDSTFSVDYEIQVLQADNITWSTIDAGLIVAK